MPKRLIFVAVLLFPAVGTFCINAFIKMLEVLGHEGLIWTHGWRYFYMFAILVIAITCYTIWSLLRFRPFGRWAGIGVSCTLIIYMFSSSADGSPFYSARRIIFNRCLLTAPFMYALYYLLSRSFGRLYSVAKQERRSLRNDAAEQPLAGDVLNAAPEE